MWRSVAASDQNSSGGPEEVGVPFSGVSGPGVKGDSQGRWRGETEGVPPGHDKMGGGGG